MPSLLALAVPALIGAIGGPVVGKALQGGGGSGSGSGRNPLLDKRAGLENQALQQLIASITGLQGDASALRQDEQGLRDSVGTDIFDFSGNPGFSGDQSDFLSQILGQLSGQTSVRPAQDEFSRLQSLLGALGVASSGNSANAQAGLNDRRGEQVAGGIGSAVGGFTESMFLQRLIDSLSAGNAGVDNFVPPSNVAVGEFTV